MYKLWVVLKVSLTRPWVWLMLLIGFTLLSTTFALVNATKRGDTKVAIPAFDEPDVVISEVLELRPPNLLNADGWRRIGRLSNLEVLSLENIGAADTQSLKTAEDDFYAALSKLTNLRQLNVQNAGGNSNWKLPPLPKLEYVVLSYNLQLEGSLETLAEHSPNLQTVALFSYADMIYTPRMIAAIRKMPRLQQIYLVSSTNIPVVDETGKQMQWLQSRLPGIAIHRGEYALGRMMSGMLLSVLCGFFPFIAWFQSGLTLSQPLAAVMPEHRRPHLFWPVAVSLLTAVCFVFTAERIGVTWSAAITIGCACSMFAATILAGRDIRSEWRRFTILQSWVDSLFLLTMLATGFFAPTTLDGFLLGDYPVLTNLLMIWFLSAAVWKITRATRLHRILAESGLPGIPGLNLGVEHMYDQPCKPTSQWSLAAWQLNRMEYSTDRRIAAMDRMNWTDMLRKGSPANNSVLVAVVMVVVFYAVFRSMTGMQNANGPRNLPIAIGIMQATLMLIMTSTMLWVGRGSSIATDFLRPVSRPQFWDSLRMAILHDLKFAFILGFAGELFAIYQAQEGTLTMFSIAIAVATGVGFFAFFHACVMLMVIGKRLWLHATLTVIASMVIVSMMACAAVMTFADQYEPLIAILLAVGVLAAGGLMQWGLARRLPDWQLA